jgi:hypothetical protein
VKPAIVKSASNAMAASQRLASIAAKLTAIEANLLGSMRARAAAAAAGLRDNAGQAAEVFAGAVQ